eukprot:55984-Amorphochlora_amoeboformis.AAC.1
MSAGNWKCMPGFFANILGTSPFATLRRCVSSSATSDSGAAGLPACQAATFARQFNFGFRQQDIPGTSRPIALRAMAHQLASVEAWRKSLQQAIDANATREAATNCESIGDILRRKEKYTLALKVRTACFKMIISSPTLYLRPFSITSLKFFSALNWETHLRAGKPTGLPACATSASGSSIRLLNPSNMMWSSMNKWEAQGELTSTPLSYNGGADTYSHIQPLLRFVLPLSAFCALGNAYCSWAELPKYENSVLKEVKLEESQRFFKSSLYEALKLRKSEETSKRALPLLRDSYLNVGNTFDLQEERDEAIRSETTN